MTTAKKLAVVLFNLGGPSDAAAVRPFLFNFFMDRNIIQLPKPLRYLFAKWISWSRGRGAARDVYAKLGGGSPLLINTQKQAEALEKSLQEKIPAARVFVSMRYWHPLSAETAREVAAFNPDQVIMLPLYPQFSTTTTYSSFQDWGRNKSPAKHAEICCYPRHPAFIESSVELLQKALEEAPKKTRVLFSAHGLPQKMIRQGDPYQWQCEETAQAIVGGLGIPLLDWKLCYQSKISRLPWTEPSLEKALEEAADDKVAVVIYPLTFVSEHVETLVELDVEYRERARHMGIPYYARVPTVSTRPQFIEGLRDMVLSRAAASACPRICPGSAFKKCYQETKHD